MNPSPYPAPSSPPSFAPLPLRAKPATATIFGTLHLTFAAIGILGAVWGLGIAMLGNPFLKMYETPELRQQLQIQLDMEKAMMPVTVVTSVLALLVAVLMVIAGVQLLRGRKNALRWSNGYAWGSLASKTIGMILAAVIMIPAMKEAVGSVGVPSDAEHIMSIGMAAGSIGGTLISCIYPVLSLILLNREAIKTWFAEQPA